MVTVGEVERYWSQYALGLDVFVNKKNTNAAYKKIKEKHDTAYANANRFLHLPGLKGKSVLELACGLGLDTIEFASYGARLTTIDISPRCLNIARNEVSSRGLRSNFLLNNAEELCFSNESFDLVVARGIITYTPEPSQLIDEIHRVLKPRGKAYALVHNKWSWYFLFAKLFRQNLYNEKKDPPINRLYKVKEAKSLFEKFCSIRIQMDRLPTRALNRNGPLFSLYDHLFIPLVKLMPQALVKPFGYYILIEATK